MLSQDAARVTVIIPTLCERERTDTLEHAIKSIRDGNLTAIKILLVINGQRFDSQLVEKLKGRTDIEIIQIAEGSLPNAHYVGRKAITTEFFSFLDDDDEFLPGSLDIRIKSLDDNKQADIVVSNGYNNRNGRDIKVYSDLNSVSSLPLSYLYKENWLSSCNSMFRTNSIDVSFFNDPHAYMEWTWLAFMLCMKNKTIIGLDELTFRCNDTSDSLSKSTNHLQSRVTLYKRMLAMTPPSDIEKTINGKMVDAWHQISEKELKNGNKSTAFMAHIKSITSHKNGIKYLPFTRKFLY